MHSGVRTTYRRHIASPALSGAVAAASIALLAATGCDGERAGQTTIEFWAIGSEGERVRPLIERFEQQHPKLRVNLQQIPWTAAHEKLLTAFVGDSLPDLCQLGNTWIAEFSAIGALADLSRRVGPDEAVDPAAYFPGVWQANVIGDAVYGVPWYVDTRVMFYRTDLLAAAGFDEPPHTWDQWLAAMRTIQQRQGPGQHAMLLPTNEWEQPIIFGLQTGADMLRDDGRFGDFSAPEFRRAFDFYAQIFAEGLAPKIANTEVTNLWKQFERGDFAFYITGPWNVGEFQRRLSPAMDGKWATAALPAPDGDYPGASMAGGCSLALFDSSGKQDAAWELIEFLTAPEQQVEFFGLSGNLPSNRLAWDADELAGAAHLAAFGEQLEKAKSLPRVPEWEQIAMKTWVAGEMAVNGRRTTAEALAWLDRQVDSILEKRRWMLAQRTLAGSEND
ncbi:MAG: ABC transporter substrate-binding protein [Planctomycetaceae bacterium]|nr:ABC transporter substrate-binding protein [Planctomycetaceae bacterium]